MYASKQVAARYAVNKAIVKGELPHLSRRFDTEIKCVDCGKPAQCWDHRDYDKPLDVEPVCGSCNGKRGQALPGTRRTNMVDFQKLINDIKSRSKKHSLAWIAERCEANISTIQMIKDTPGRQPRYDLGEKLVKLERRTRPRRPRG